MHAMYVVLSADIFFALMLARLQVQYAALHMQAYMECFLPNMQESN